MTAHLPRRCHLLVALALAASPAVHRADTIRCDGGIVAEGDTKLDLLGKCGEPTLREPLEGQQLRALAAPGSGGEAARLVPEAERWTYNYGPSRFVVYVTLEGGRVRAVERGGYGYELPGPVPARRALPVARCDYHAFRIGDRAFDVLARCGEPALRDVRTTRQNVALPPGGRLRAADAVVVTVDVWTYNFGPSVFARVLEFEDGKLVRVETGGRGYAP